MEEIIEVRRVLQRTDGIKYLIIPKKSLILKDDLVVVTKYGETKWLKRIKKLKKKTTS